MIAAKILVFFLNKCNMLLSITKKLECNMNIIYTLYVDNRLWIK